MTTSLKKLFAIDPHSLALFRIGMGALLLIDLAVRASDLRAMYTDAGMFPRSLICPLFNTPWHWSFHFLSGSAELQMGLFFAAALFAVALLIGFQTRVAAVASWVMLVSIHHRAPGVLSGADYLLRMLLFWGMFLPLDRKWSVSAKAKAEVDAPVVSFASAGILIQMAVMYFASAVAKTNEHWILGDALAGSLSHSFFGSSAGRWLLQFPTLLQLLTWFAFALEYVGPALLFVPWKNAKLRVVVIVLLALMHIGIEITMNVALFSYVALAGLVLFIPPEIWKRSALKPVVYGSPKLQAACAVFLVYLFFAAFGVTWRPFLIGMGFNERWPMFGAIPTNDGWYVARATLKDGSEIDLLRDGAPVQWERPRNPVSVYPNSRWQKLFREMAYFDDMGFQVYRAPVAAYMCREWKARHPEREIAEFEFVYCAPVQPDLFRPTRTFVRQPLVHLELAGE